MLKLVETKREIQKVRAFCANGYFGAKINAALAAYGTDERFVRTWYEEADGRILTAVQLTESTATVKTSEQTDFASLTSLLLFTGAKTLAGECKQLEKLPFSPDEQSVIMQAQSVVLPGVRAEKISAEQLKDLYAILFPEKANEKSDRAYMEWLADLSHRVRHGMCECFGVIQNEELVSCACILYSNAHCGCIGAVATKKAHRGRGYAAACVYAAARACKTNGTIPTLLCKEEMTKWYEQLGFEPCGRAVNYDLSSSTN